jgi:hypothetical protein
MSVLTWNFYLYSFIHKLPNGFGSGLDINRGCKPVFRFIWFLEQGWQTLFLSPAVRSYWTLPAIAGRSIVAVVDILRLLLHIVSFKILGLWCTNSTWFILDFKVSRCFECHMLSFGFFPGVCSLNANVSEHCLFHLHRRVGVKCDCGWEWAVLYVKRFGSKISLSPLEGGSQGGSW